MIKNSYRLPQFALTVVAVVFGFSFLFTKSALDSLGIFQLLGLRFLTAAIFLTLLLLTGVIKVNLKWGSMKELMVVALFQPVLYFMGETIGVGMSSASEASIIISLVPISITVLAVFLLNERLNLIQWFYIAVSVGGVILIVAAKGEGGGRGHVLGIAALLGAVLAAGLYNVLSRKVSVKFTPVEITFVMMWVGAVVFNLAGICLEAYHGNVAGYFSGLMRLNVLLDLLYLGIVSSVIAFFLLNYALSKMEASRTAVFMNLIPVITVLAGIIFRGESFLPLQCLGAVLVLVGLFGTNRNAGTEKKTFYK